MGTMTQAASAFAVLIGRRRSQPSDESLLTEVGSLPAVGLPSGLRDVVPDTDGHGRGFGCASPKEKATEEPLSAPGLYLIGAHLEVSGSHLEMSGSHLGTLRLHLGASGPHLGLQVRGGLSQVR